MSFRNIKDFFALFILGLVVKKRNFLEFFRVFKSYYHNIQFLKADCLLFLFYFFRNPFRVSKDFLLQKGERSVHVYGETPLTAFHEIVENSAISENDTVFELGCGRGKTSFWLGCFVGCKVVGIETNPIFSERAEWIRKSLKIQNIEFRNEDMLMTDFRGASVIYLYGTCLEDEFIMKLLERFEALPVGTRFITVSYPLMNYTLSPKYCLEKSFEACFTWGKTCVYLHSKIS